MGSDVHALPKIEAVCPETLDAGIEMKLLTPLALSKGKQPFEKRSAKPAALVRSTGHQVLDIKNTTPGQAFGKMVARDPAHQPVRFSEGELITA